MTLPTFFIIGAAKAGTTSLHFYLDQHPEIQMSGEKEPNFFSGPANGIPYPAGRIADIAGYEALFDPAFGVRGEASVGYANYPRRKCVPERIAESVPEPKFIYIVRDPVERVVSHYQHRVAAEGERRTMPEALEDFSDPLSVYLCPSFYAGQLERYLEMFPLDSILVVDQAALLADRGATLRGIFEFLRVDPEFASGRFDEELYRGDQRRIYPRGYAGLIAPLERSRLTALIPRGARRSLRRGAERLLWPQAPRAQPTEELRGRLEDLYRADAARLRSLTGQDFPTWSV